MTTPHAHPSDTFSFERFRKLLYAETRVNGKAIVIKLLILFLPSLALFSLVGYKIKPLALDTNLLNHSGWWILFIFLFFAGYMVTFILGILSATRSFKAYHRRETGFAAFMLPASNSEKFCSAYLVHAFFVPIAYFILFGLSTLPSFVALNHAFIEFQNDFQSQFGFSISETSGTSIQILPYVSIFLYFLAAQTIFFAGSITFRTWPFIKTILVIIAIAILLGFAAGLLGNLTLASFFTSEEANGPIAAIASSTFFMLIALGIAWYNFSRAILK